MLKCEVIDNTVIAVGKGSIVYVSERQYELARKVLKPIKAEEKKVEKSETTEKVEEKVETVETTDVPKKETRKKKK